MSDDEPPRVSLWEIFKVFLVIGLTAFGGGVNAHVHHAVVQRKKWLDDRRYLEGMTVARIVPGANASNLAAFVGAMLAGPRGAAVAVAGVVLPGLFAVLGLAAVYVKLAQHSEAFPRALHGLSAGAVGIMASLLLNAAKPVVKSAAGIPAAALAFVAVAIFKVNMLLVIVALTPIASLLTRDEAAQ